MAVKDRQRTAGRARRATDTTPETISGRRLHRAHTLALKRRAIVGIVDDLKREVGQDAELQDVMRLLADRLSKADLDELGKAAERNDLEAIAKALDLQSVAQLEALDMTLWQRAQHYKRYPDLKRFRQG